MDVFYLRRRGVPLVLSSISSYDFSVLSESVEFRILSSSPLSVFEKESAERAVSAEAEISLYRYLQERRYIPRLLVSAALFLFLYLFLSIAVPDPIPVIDEILLSFLASAALWVILARADRRSSFMREKLECIDSSLQKSAVTISSSMANVEEWYDNLYSYSLLETSRMIATASLPALSIDEAFGKSLSDSLLLHLRREDKGIDRTLRRIGDGDEEKTARFLVHQVTTGSLDILDLALFMAVKEKN